MARSAGSATARLAAFAAASVLVLTGAWTAGSATATLATADDDEVLPASTREAAAAEPGGVLSTAAGYTLSPARLVYPWRKPAEVAFTVTGSDGRPVTGFDTPGDGSPAMDVAVIRRDVAGYTRLRATRGPDGVWRAPVTFPGEGVWRLYAGFTPTGGPRVDLGADLHVPGPYGAFQFPAEDRSGRCGTGDQQVRVDGALLPGGRSRLYVTVGRDGAPVTDLEPVDGGAFGLMTAVRQGDLARFPATPEVTGARPDDRAGPGIAFTASVPAAGSYRLFVDYRSGGELRSCEFTVPTARGS
ncbi:hypothetical protein H7X46_04040 [Pseudonocardia sp. C8]|uniref:hypothetical protein n=1 Tax=Pseudonocardia sp. C8 TaxID=2762759 RepID=UPI0016424DE6|nr:hypothetical protein [Pseudonocardia sp. C8]MBC3190232.1 hypothetical protein [Pseudonocardia sp. C8]